jgi:hypothetical protein
MIEKHPCLKTLSVGNNPQPLKIQETLFLTNRGFVLTTNTQPTIHVSDFVMLYNEVTHRKP